MSSKMSNSLVGLSDNIRILSFSKGDGYLKRFIEAKNPVHRCPACGSAHCNIQSSKWLRAVQHLSNFSN